LICSFSFSVFLDPLLPPESRSAQADRGKSILDPRLWPLGCLYFHLLQFTRYQPLFGVQAYRNINNLF
jgi:hypothetical protein